MNVLHISNDYSGSQVYKSLIKNLDNKGIEQTVYHPVRSAAKVGKNNIRFDVSSSQIIYSHILNNYTRINFKYKEKKIFEDLKFKFPDIDKYNLTHAHTWYSDGAIALAIKKQFGIPYVLAIRNTDLNLFYKYMFHLRKLGIEILEKAESIIVISPQSKLRMEQILKNASRTELIEKLLTISNGVDPFWIKNWSKKKKVINSPVELIFVGGFDRNKNVQFTIDAYKILKKEGLVLKLNLVGDSTNSRLKQINKHDENIVFHGFLKNKNNVSDLLRKSDIFVMPSHSETFGLVYVEALSQGVPVVYTKGEGIDGFYDSSIGESVDSNDLESITNGIRKIILNYALYNFNSKKIAENHDWNTISKQYLNIYESVSSK
jgi:glycosyltransferase involved in cell wall biosynthesis